MTMRGALVLAFAALAASTARAQVLDVRLRDQGTDKPVLGAVVRLLRGDVEVAQALTNADGRAVLKAPDAGVFRLRVNRIGFKAVTVDSIVLERGATFVKQLSMSSIPFVLPAVEVQTGSQCGTDFTDGAAVAGVWEQVSTALAANVLTQAQWQLPLKVERFKRTLSLKDSVERDLTVGSYVVYGPPFGATDPAVLERQGFVFDERESTVFAAPDAQTILSDAFVTTHCFRVVAGPGGRIGLAFEPVPRRKLSDVTGTLWIDRATSELRSLDYLYVKLPRSVDQPSLGGHLDFKRLPSGAWIVSYWHIRMPKLNVIPGDVRMYNGQRIVRPDTRQLESYIEEGGRVTPLENQSEVALVDALRATAIGTIVDSTTNGPLVGALIRLAGERDSAVTDSAGRFRLQTRSAGTHVIIASHPKLGLIADGSTKEAHLSLGGTTRVDFAVPPSLKFVQEFCGPATRDVGLVGRALSASGTGLEGYEIRITWAVTGKFFDERSQTGPNGIYALCNLPASNAFTVRVQQGEKILAKSEVRLDAGQYKWLDLRVPPSQ